MRRSGSGPGSYAQPLPLLSRELANGAAPTNLRSGSQPVGRAVNFGIKTEELADHAYLVALSGEVDLYTAPEFKQELLDLIAQGAKQVIVDFSETTFIDSTTLGVLVGGVKRLRPNGGRLSLVCNDRNITKIFEITGLNKVFPIYESRAEAVESVGQEAQAQT